MADDWKEKLGEKTRSILLRAKKVGAPQFSQLEPLAIAGHGSRWIQGQGLAFWGKLASTILSAYFLSDITAILVGNLIPEPGVGHSARIGSVIHHRTIDDYGVIFSRNLFNSKGLIPGEDQGTSVQDLGGAPVRTTLPLNLVGTMILQDEARSIATIEDKAASMIYPVREDDEIPGKVKILKIEPKKVIFVNVSSGRREFIDLPEESTDNPRIALGSSTKPSGPGIEQVSPTQFNISRTEIDKTMSDLNTVLTQARAVPNFENGVAAGYKLFQIVPGSIYDKLGLKNGDTIAGLNGAPITDPGKAFEMLSTIKDQSHVDIQVKRDGRAQSFSYDFH